MLADGLEADRERFGKLIDSRFAAGKPRQDLASRWIRERGEGSAELVLFDLDQPLGLSTGWLSMLTRARDVNPLREANQYNFADAFPKEA